MAERVFNRCTTANMKDPDNPNYQITFNYEFLDDMYANWRETDSLDNLSSSGGTVNKNLKHTDCLFISREK